MKNFAAVVCLVALVACGGGLGPATTSVPYGGHTSRSGGGYRQLYSVDGKAGGGILWAGVAVDAGGNIFGAAMQGGKHCPLPSTQTGCGVAFELAPKGDRYEERVLHDFAGPTDGVYPEAAPVPIGGGALVGTTLVGGDKHCRTCGTAYELMPQQRTYRERIVHYFGRDAGGNLRLAALTVGKGGVLYGVTPAGGPNRCGCGAVFALVPNASGYRIVTLHVFSGKDGAVPLGPLAVGSDGTIYGTASGGGKTNCSVSGVANGCGVTFALVASPKGYQERIAHAFAGGADGIDPDGTLSVDAAGTIYGTAEAGGGAGCRHMGCGIAYSLTPNGGGYRETILYRFRGGADASIPRGGLVAGPNGSFYTFTDGGQTGGAIVELLPRNGKYADAVVHQFGSGSDGYAPEAPLFAAPDGSLYGTTLLGGAYGVGTVFKYTP